MNFLILSSMLHYFAIMPFTKKGLLHHNKIYDYYMLTIIISTTLSILWYINKPSNGLLLYLDYIFTIIWFAQDYYLAMNKNNLLLFMKIIYVNTIIFTFNLFIFNNIFFERTHSIYNILSAIKCFYVSYLLAN
jgi:hypothetical protein